MAVKRNFYFGESYIYHRDKDSQGAGADCSHCEQPLNGGWYLCSPVANLHLECVEPFSLLQVEVVRPRYKRGTKEESVRF